MNWLSTSGLGPTTYPREAFEESVLDAAEGGEAPPGGGPASSSAHFADVLKQFARRNSLS